MSTKVTPKIPTSNRAVDYEDLEEGDAFLYTDGLYIKYDAGLQGGISLTNPTEDFLDDMCGKMVAPVDIEIKWAYKPAKKKVGRPKK